jgi:hypothetical protein
MTKYSIAIDPGWVNCSISLASLTGSEVKHIKSLTLNPSSIESRDRCSQVFSNILTLVDPKDVEFVTIERYVSYSGVNTAEAENILMLIGGLKELAMQYFPDADIILHRALDWKMALVKLLFKAKDFRNPSDKLDKKFSLAAAKACFDNPTLFQNDHDADSSAMAALPFLRSAYESKPKTN